MSVSAISNALRKQVFARDKGTCQYCQLRQIGQAAVFHINHIVPKSRGGVTEESNLVLQCPWCSLHKSNKVNAADPRTQQVLPLFHPLTQTWREHFWCNAAGVCNGLTPIGRATVEALRMNDALPRIARSIQIRMKLLTPGRADN